MLDFVLNLFYRAFVEKIIETRLRKLRGFFFSGQFSPDRCKQVEMRGKRRSLTLRLPS